MTTLIIVGNSEGERRCDEKCYNAQGSICKCCCGGRNHGVGLQKAVDQSMEIYFDLVRQSKRNPDIKYVDLNIEPELATWPRGSSAAAL